MTYCYILGKFRDTKNGKKLHEIGHCNHQNTKSMKIVDFHRSNSIKKWNWSIPFIKGIDQFLLKKGGIDGPIL